jgi:hypothetical protein
MNHQLTPSSSTEDEGGWEEHRVFPPNNVIQKGMYPKCLFGVVSVVSLHVVDAFNAFAQFAPLLQQQKKSSSSTAAPPPPPSQVKTESWLDVLKYDEPPTFDVLAKTIEYANVKDFDTIMTYYADDYIFRGPIVGPITGEDVRKTSEVSYYNSHLIYEWLSSHCINFYDYNWTNIDMLSRVSTFKQHILIYKRVRLDLLLTLTIHTDATSSNVGRGRIP